MPTKRASVQALCTLAACQKTCPRAIPGSADAGSLQWPAGTAIPAALSSQLHCLAEPALLKALAQQALPLSASTGVVDAAQQASTVHSLCQLLQAIARVPALCQKALIFAAGPADFVNRLWSSYLQVSSALMCVPAC